MRRMLRLLSPFLALCIFFAGFTQTAQAALIGADQVARAAADPQGQRARIAAVLERPAVLASLEERGVSPDEARQRLAALSDEQASRLAAQLDTAPAGGNDVLAAILIVFLVLLITDLLGYTNIFPFTRSMR